MNIKRIMLPVIGVMCLILLSACGGENGDDRDHEYLPDEEPDTMDERVEHPPDTLGDDQQERLAELRQKLQDEPDNPEWHYQRAKHYFENEQFPLARNDIENALEMEDEEPDYYLLKAQILWEITLPSSTIAILEDGIEKFPENTDLMVQLAEYQMILQNYEEAMRLTYEAIEIDQYIPKAYFIRGFTFKEMNEIDRAISSFQTTVEIDPQHYDAYVHLGLLSQEKEEARDRTRHYFENALNINPESEDALYGRGLYYQNNEEYEKAAEDYERLLEFNEDHQQTHYNLGFVYLLKNKNEKAADHFTESIKRAPSHTNSYYARGLAFRNLEKVPEAINDFEKVLELDQNFQLARQEIADLSN